MALAGRSLAPCLSVSASCLGSGSLRVGSGHELFPPAGQILRGGGDHCGFLSADRQFLRVGDRVDLSSRRLSARAQVSRLPRPLTNQAAQVWTRPQSHRGLACRAVKNDERTAAATDEEAPATPREPETTSVPPLPGTAEATPTPTPAKERESENTSFPSLEDVNPIALGRRSRQLFNDVSAAAKSASPTTTTTAKDRDSDGTIFSTLEDVNPVGLGRRSRQLFDDVWRRLTELGQLTRSLPPPDNAGSSEGGPYCDFTIPNAEFTTVLVAGATGRVGRVLVRKLLLRGYKVKALVRRGDPETLSSLPRAVQVVVGDLTDANSLQAAVEGCQKVICCAAARSTADAEELSQVDHRGVYNLAKTFMDAQHKMAAKRRGRSSRSKLTIAKKFNSENGLDGWELREGMSSKDELAIKYDMGMDAQFEALENGAASFSGYVYTRGGHVEAVKRLGLNDGALSRYEGLLLRVKGDRKQYWLVLETTPSPGAAKGAKYVVRMSTREGYSRVRVPFTVFRPLNPADPPLDVGTIRSLAIRFEPRRTRTQGAARTAGGRPTVPPESGSAAAAEDPNTFQLEVDYIKAFPGGDETDFILVSCAGAAADPAHRERVLAAKMAGEGALRKSGLGYTIVRPGPLQEEPGGQRALVFDQGNRITQGISCADVADVCVKALHDQTARNKSFDVCYEYAVEEGRGLYELVAHLPDKSNNYLTPALALLEPNT